MPAPGIAVAIAEYGYAEGRGDIEKLERDDDGSVEVKAKVRRK
jgi:hypothetical protein